MRYKILVHYWRHNPQSTIHNLPLASLPAAHANTTDITDDNKSISR